MLFFSFTISIFSIIISVVIIIYHKDQYRVILTLLTLLYGLQYPTKERIFAICTVLLLIEFLAAFYPLILVL